MPLGGLEEREGKLRKNENTKLDTTASPALGIERRGGREGTHHLERDPEIEKKSGSADGDAELDRRRRGKKAAASGGDCGSKTLNLAAGFVSVRGGNETRRRTREP